MSYTPNKQRILEALGYKAEERPRCDCGDCHCDYYYDTVFRIVGKESLGYSCDTEPEAWDSVDFDANFCEEELKAYFLQADRNLQLIFTVIIFEMVAIGVEVGMIDVWLALTPERLCEAFESFLTSIGK